MRTAEEKEALHAIRRKRAPRWLILGLAVTMLINTGLAVTCIGLEEDYHQTGLENQRLEQKYVTAAAALSRVATPIEYNITLICDADHLPCKALVHAHRP